MSMAAIAQSNFLAAFAALFAVSNPIGCALIYSQMAANLERYEQALLARRIAFNAVIVLLIAMWAGGLLLSLFGISMDALRTAGGLVIAVQAWKLLSEEASDDAKVSQRDAFFPLTIPLTTGPGTISVAIALGSGGPEPPGGCRLCYGGNASGRRYGRIDCFLL